VFFWKSFCHFKKNMTRELVNEMMNFSLSHSKGIGQEDDDLSLHTHYEKL
jgi:hypothetical protein